MHLRLFDVAHVVPAEARTLGKDPAESDCLVEQRARQGKRAPGVRVDAAVRQKQPWADSTRIGPGKQQVSETSDGLWADCNVLSHQHHLTALAALDPDGSA